jgi:hypothetical protein
VISCIRLGSEKVAAGGSEKNLAWNNSLHGEANTETNNVVTAIRFVLVTRRRAKLSGIISEGTATQHTLFTIFWSLWINHILLWIISVPILTPLPNIAVHVVKTPGIGWVTSYRRGIQWRRAFLEFSESGLLGRNSVAKEERCSCPSTTSVLPLGLCRQAIRFLILFSHFLDKRLAIIP